MSKQKIPTLWAGIFCARLTAGARRFARLLGKLVQILDTIISYRTRLQFRNTFRCGEKLLCRGALIELGKREFGGVSVIVLFDNNLEYFFDLSQSSHCCIPH